MTSCTYRDYYKTSIDYIEMLHLGEKKWIYDYIRRTFDVSNGFIFTSHTIASGFSLVEMLMKVDISGIRHDRNFLVFAHIKQQLSDRDMNLLADACRQWKIEMLVSDDD